MNAPMIDFLRPGRTPLLGWLLLVAGALAAGVALRLEQRLDDARTLRDQAQWQREQADATERQRREAAARPTPDSRRLDTALLEARRPWLPTLQAVETATVPPVYVLDFSVDPARGQVHLEGEAPDFDHAVAYVENLGGSNALVQARLASHEAVTDPATSRQLVRFTVNARWDAGR